MFVEETKLVELRDGQAVVSTKDLFRIVELPSGRTVGELANGDEAGGARSEFWDLPNSKSPYRVSVEYLVLKGLAARGLTVADIAIAPTSGTQCRWCGSEIKRRTKKACVYACGTRGDLEKKPLNDRGFEVFWTRGEQTEPCVKLEAERIASMAPKAALLKEILLECGVTSLNSDEWWIFDGRGDDEQFPGIDVSVVQIPPALTSLDLPIAATAMMV